MSKPAEPPRLELDAESGAAELIEALRGDGPGPDRMRRIGQKLEPSFGPAGARVNGGSLFGGWFGKAASIGVALLAAGGLFAWWPRAHPHASTQAARGTYEQRPAPVAPAARAPEASAEAVAPAAPAAPARVSSSAVPRETVGVQVQPGREPPGTPAPPSRVAVRPRAQRTRSAESAGVRPDAPATAAAASEEILASAPPARTTDAVHVGARTALDLHAGPVADATKEAPQVAPATQAEPSEPAARAERASASPPAASVAPAALDEAGLLQRARRLAHDRPDQALRLLEEHRRRFGQGMLAPEREVLAIEILRAEGRRAEAERRLQAFRSRYPDSVYLERLGR